MPHFGGENDLFPREASGASYERFVVPHAINGGRIKEGDSEVERDEWRA
jgi:hypothetical protein